MSICQLVVLCDQALDYRALRVFLDLSSQISRSGEIEKQVLLSRRFATRVYRFTAFSQLFYAEKNLEKRTIKENLWDLVSP